ncbi:ribosomal protein L34 [Allomyces macrogynus ATCC 38327]|uniref:Large ribosomal subunit protein bL34m n=1 Tax=Allomyces macrogynus (strain ATCC 38327) TaxID=578462 RepID=A0A0L0T9G3_ALLM3|nr:ribosomal protein L34 [Allomyces macrogynus ATCC 38327]|eukprot:KNE71387.1 ribosomal protein L34 [Allomyces macrogynus ATCC 38327]
MSLFLSALRATTAVRAGSLAATTSSLLPRLAPPALTPAAVAMRTPLSAPMAYGPFTGVLGARGVKFGTEYQPSIIRRKRKWGFLARANSKAGRKILHRRMLKGRKYLSH